MLSAISRYPDIRGIPAIVYICERTYTEAALAHGKFPRRREPSSRCEVAVIATSVAICTICTSLRVARRAVWPAFNRLQSSSRPKLVESKELKGQV